MFSTNTNLALIAEAPIYMDGTFQICSRLFYQVFTLHAFKHGQQFPLVYFLLPGKSWEAYNTSYNTSFILLNEAAQNIGLEVDPYRLWTSFTAVSCYLLSTGRKERVPLPLRSGYLEKGTESWTTATLQGRWWVQLGASSTQWLPWPLSCQHLCGGHGEG